MERLIGAWSADALYAPGPSDEVVCFLESGEGWIEYLNWGLCAIETFKWWRNEDGTLNIKGEIVNSIIEPLSKSDSVFSNLKISISDGLTSTKANIIIMTVENGDLFLTDKYGKLDQHIDIDFFQQRLRLIDKKQ